MAWGIRQGADKWSMGHGAGSMEHARSEVTSPAKREGIRQGADKWGMGSRKAGGHARGEGASVKK